jgi:hypothetical protein
MRKVRPDIKPCPYTTCGHQAVLIGEGEENDSTLYWVECEGCCANGPYSDDADAAVDAWNEIPRNEPNQITQATCPVCGGKGIIYDPFDRTKRICEICQPVRATAEDLRQILIKVETLQGIRVPVDLLRHLNKIESALQAAIKWATPVVPTKEQP